MTLLLDGKKARDHYTLGLTEKIAHMKESSLLIPTLAIIQVGDRVESTTYINQKKVFGEKIGARVLHVALPETISEKDVCAKITELNGDASVHGVIVQLPLPEHINKTMVIETIDPHKDVDGLTAVNTKKLWSGASGHVPATARGIISLLTFYNIPIAGKRVVVVGRSDLVGKPTALALLNHGATVTVCHRQTTNLAEETKRADILIVAAGSPGLITKDHITSEQIIVDVGINVVDPALHNGKKIVGDVLFDEIQDTVTAISPVPGGVGPMTVLSLFQNLLDACVVK